MLELRDQLNDMRAGVGIAPLALSVTAGDLIHAAELQTLRNAANDARVAWGLSPVVFTESLSGAVVKASQLNELREALR